MKKLFNLAAVLSISTMLSTAALAVAPETRRDVDARFGALNNTKVDGFRPIWFSLGAGFEYGYKYSGGLGTYTVKHRPMAIYCEAVDKTYFVFGGTTDKERRHLLCMISCYDHKTGMVQKPLVVYDKGPVDDPHDDPAILIDPEGYIWVYVAGRGNTREGYRYRSIKPYDISEFVCQGSSIMAYPQCYYVPGKGHFLFDTRYDGVRRLFWQTSPDGRNWSEYHPLGNIIEPYAEHSHFLGWDELKTVTFGPNGETETKSGHYQVTGQCGEKLVSAFNRHPDGKCDFRTSIYYVQTTDFGEHWTQADGTPVELPITRRDDPCRILNTEANGQTCYIKDVNFDEDGNPVILYVTAYGREPGPAGGPREWNVIRWNGRKWVSHRVTSSTNGYDSGSIYVTGKTWTIIGPTEAGPSKWGVGGEISSWVSTNKGRTWKKALDYTRNSPQNHSYVRRPVDARDPFYCFWADGNPDVFSQSHIFMGDSKGNVWRLPYDMKDEWAKPEKMRYYSDEECRHPIPKE